MPTAPVITTWAGICCHVTSLLTVVVTVLALLLCDIAPLYQGESGGFNHDFTAATYILATALTLEAFTLIAALSGSGDEDELGEHKPSDSSLMMIVYSCLFFFYHVMAKHESFGIIHTDPFAGGRPVYTLRYVEWSCAVPILMFLGGRSVPREKGHPPTALLPAILLTAVYIYASLIALVVTSFTWRVVLIVVSFFGYGVASVDQIVGWTRAIDFKGSPTAPASFALVVTQVVLFGVYGVVFLLACGEIISPALEQALYTFGDVTAKVGHSALLVTMRRQSSARAVKIARREAAESADNW